VPVTRVQASRISYELGEIDFDLDCLPHIPPFMEIDAADSKADLKELLAKLDLRENEVIVATTPEIFAHYGKDYFAEFAIHG